MEQISITLEPDVASAYLRARPDVREKAQATINLWLKELFTSRNKVVEDFFSSIDELSEIAQQNGLTPEILKQILNEKK